MTSPAPSKPVNTAPDYKLGAVLPHVKRAAEHFGPMFGISTILGWRATARDMGGHPAGLALDFMCDLSTGKALNSALHADAAAFGLKYTIHNQTYYPVDGAPEPMEDRGSDTQNHIDHVHAQYKLTGGDGSVPKGYATDVNVPFWQRIDNGLDELNPFDGWQADVVQIGLTLVALGTAATLVIVGIKNLSGDKNT